MKLRRITKADLKRHVPCTLAFRDHTLRLKTIEKCDHGQAYVATYNDEEHPEFTGTLGAGLLIPRLPRRLLLVILKDRLRAMYWELVRRERVRRRMRGRWSVTVAYLERVLPPELTYRGHTLTLRPFRLTELTAYAIYRCDTFFDCPQHSLIAGALRFGRANSKEYMDSTLRHELRRLYEHLDSEVAKETAQGCSILPSET